MPVSDSSRASWIISTNESSGRVIVPPPVKEGGTTRGLACGIKRGDEDGALFWPAEGLVPSGLQSLVSGIGARLAPRRRCPVIVEPPAMRSNEETVDGGTIFRTGISTVQIRDILYSDFFILGTLTPINGSVGRLPI